MTIEFTPENAAHLLRRTGFGPRASEVAKWSKLGLNKTVDELLEGGTSGKTKPKKKSIEEIKAWWIRRLVASKNPLADKMALFWHDHFATAFGKVGSVTYMYKHLKKLRGKALLPFNKLLPAILKDSALVIWLDSHENKKGAPNDNLARESMEIFTTGVLNKNGNPNYTEKDVKEAARALTGWSQERGKFLFEAGDHDGSSKKIKGVQGKLDGHDFIQILLDDPATSRHIVWKLFCFFAYEVPLSDPVLDPLVSVWKSEDSSIRAVLGAMFRMDAFYSAEAKADRVKSPAEFMIGALRQLKAKVKSSKKWSDDLAFAMRALGQDLLDPPSVFGWEQGLAWTATDGLLQRVRVAEQIAGSRPEVKGPLSWKAKVLFGKSDTWDEQALDAGAVVQRVLDTLSIPTPSASTRSALVDYMNTAPNGSQATFVLNEESFDTKVRGVVALALASPEYQLS